MAGGTGPFTWSVPARSPTAGGPRLAGALTRHGHARQNRTNFTVKVVDANGISDSQAVALVVVAAPSIGITLPPVGEVGVGYAFSYSVTGGTGPFSWSVSAGSLPAGLSLNTGTGAVTGTRRRRNLVLHRARGRRAEPGRDPGVVDQRDRWPESVPSRRPRGRYGPVFHDVDRDRWHRPVHLVGGLRRPARGLLLGANTGKITGTPTTAGTSTAVIRVTDVNGQTATESTTIAITAAPSIGSAAPPAGEDSPRLTASGSPSPAVPDRMSGRCRPARCPLA